MARNYNAMFCHNNTDIHPTPAEILSECYEVHKENCALIYCPTMLLLQSEVADSLNYEERLSILHDISEHHTDYLRPLGASESEMASFSLECRSLIHYNEIIARFMQDRRHRLFVQDNISEERPIPKMEQFLYIQELHTLDMPHYIAFIEAYALYCSKHCEQADKQIPTLSMAILQTWNCLGKMYAKDIISFCKHLYMGESVRQHEIGLLGDDECLNIRTFDVAFRNRCFDEYIRICLKAIKEKVDADNDRLYPPSELDYMQELLHKESCAYEREMSFEQFRGSQAYHDMYYLGRPDVLKMAGYFIQYLRDSVERMQNNQPESVATPITYNYYAGSIHEDHSKHVILKADE